MTVTTPTQHVLNQVKGLADLATDLARARQSRRMAGLIDQEAAALEVGNLLDLADLLRAIADGRLTKASVQWSRAPDHVDG